MEGREGTKKEVMEKGREGGRQGGRERGRKEGMEREDTATSTDQKHCSMGKLMASKTGSGEVRSLRSMIKKRW